VCHKMADRVSKLSKDIHGNYRTGQLDTQHAWKEWPWKKKV